LLVGVISHYIQLLQPVSLDGYDERCFFRFIFDPPAVILYGVGCAELELLQGRILGEQIHKVDTVCTPQMWRKKRVIQTK
jgi:hypothetical protein